MNSPQTLFDTHLPPLAERVRPKTIDEFYGQAHLVDEGKIVHRLTKQSATFSIIFWGPPGTGKTTLARIIAKSSQAKIRELSAVSSGVKDLREVITFAKSNREMGKKTILFIDEIHRFSKSQQDALLHAVEDGTITLFGATTENPSFEVISPLLSRCRVLTLRSLEKSHLQNILNNVFDKDVILSKSYITIKDSEKNLPIKVFVINFGKPLAMYNFKKRLADIISPVERNSPFSINMREIFSFMLWDLFSKMIPRVFSSSSPNGTPEGQALSHARQSMQRFKGSITCGISSSSPSHKPRIK